MNFDATATYSAEIIGIAILANGSATVTVRNKDAQGNTISDVVVSVPATHANPMTHERTGDTGIVASLDFADAIDAAIVGANAALASIIAVDKHAL